jgi:hypothetical protein
MSNRSNRPIDHCSDDVELGEGTGGSKRSLVEPSMWDAWAIIAEAAAQLPLLITEKMG